MRSARMRSSERVIAWMHGQTGLGAMDLVALLVLVFVLWLAALQMFPSYASRSAPPTPTAKSGA